jgi:hypothetical protein
LVGTDAEGTEHIDQAAFARWLRVQLRLKGIQANALPAMISVHHATVARWLAGTSQPQPRILFRLAGVLEEDVCLLQSLLGIPTSSATLTLAPHEVELLSYFRRLSPEQWRVVLDGVRSV